MSWQVYVDDLMSDGVCQDAAIVGYKMNKFVWAAHIGGVFANITLEEIEALETGNRSPLFTNGLTLGAKRCSIIRDGLFAEDDLTMDIRTKSSGGEPTYNIVVARAFTLFVIVMGKEGIHGGKLNKKAFDMAQHLKQSGC